MEKRTHKNKTGKRKWIPFAIVCGVVMVGVACILNVKSKTQGRNNSKQMTATVSKGTIQTGVSGTGTISYADVTDIVLPSDLEISELFVSEGSFVTKGTLLATVDDTSLTACLTAVQEAISEVDTTISSEMSNNTTKSIKAGVAGRVKKIYANEDDSIIDVMKEEGALMLLSTDDSMAVKIEGVENTNSGDEVTVSNGDTDTTGTIESIENGVDVVLFDDSVFDCDTQVSVCDADGNILGSGNAYIHAPIQVVGTSGIISSLNVSLDEEVSASTKLYTLEDSSQSATYTKAVKNREELVALLETLVSIETDGGIMATSDGMVETINIDGSSSTVSSSSENGVILGESITQSETETAKVVLTNMEKSDTEGSKSGFMTMSTMSQTGGPVTEESSTKDNTMEEKMASSEETEEKKTASTEEDTTVSTEEEQPVSTEEEQPVSTKEEQPVSTEETKTDTSEKFNAGNTANQSISTNLGITKSSSGGSTSSASSGSSESSDSFVETVSAFVIANGDKMVVTMNVDELDILSMKEGLSAEITLDAVEGTVFAGEITSVSGSANSGSGVAQYPVEITFDKTEEMLSGMNASVEVILEQAEDVLLIPLTAVVDEGNASYVYTGYDESSGELTDKMEVTLGVSDDTNVEIKSGLSEGETIYYLMEGSEESNNQFRNGMGGFGMPGTMQPGGKGDMNGQPPSGVGERPGRNSMGN